MKEESIIRPKGRARSGSLEKKWICAGVFICKRGEIKFRGTLEVNKELLGEFKIQEDVKLHIKVRGYDYFPVFRSVKWGFVGDSETNLRRIREDALVSP